MISISKPFLTEEEARYASETILSGWVTQGPRVREFEQHFAEAVGAPYAVAVSSCTTALHLALVVAGIQPGDEVICPSLSFIATANAIRYAGALPVFADVNPITCNIDVESAADCITSRTRAVMIVHQMGMPADIEVFQDLCKKNHLHLIEDAACAVGSSYKGGRIGSHSDLVCFSFHPRKVITTGDGGMITTPREEYHDRLKRLRQHGMSINDLARHESKQVIVERYDEMGYNYRLTDVQAAMGVKQLEKLDWIIQERRKIAQRYNESFGQIECLRVPKEPEGFISNFQSYSLYLKKTVRKSRNELMQSLMDKGISTRRGIMAIHREGPYKREGNVNNLPNTEDVSDRTILLPIYAGLSNEEVDFIIQTIRSELN